MAASAVPGTVCGRCFPPAELTDQAPKGAPFAQTTSAPMKELLRRMLKFSTNLTAEAAGLTATAAKGVSTPSLIASGSRMAGWARTKFGANGVRFLDHSGLGYDSSISPQDMVEILRGDTRVGELMKSMSLPNPRVKGATLTKVAVSAKTGTLNFVSSLAGYVTTESNRTLVFAIFTADTERRDAIPPEMRGRPRGARRWANQSRNLQKQLLANWAVSFDQA